jgi:hypothetical protein
VYEAALVFSALLFLTVSYLYVRSALFSVFHPFSIYLAFHGLLFVFRPILAWALDFREIYQIYDFTPSPSDKLTALLVAQLGFAAFAFFCLRKGNVPMVFKLDLSVRRERSALRGIFPLVALICVPIGLYSLVHLYTDASLGIAYSDMIRDPRTGTAINTTGNGYLVEAQLMLASTAALIAWLYRFRLLAILPLAAFTVFRAGTGGRGPFIVALATVALLYLYEKRARLPVLPVLAAMVAAVLLFNLVGTDRGEAIRNLIGSETTRPAASEASTRPLEGMDFGNLEYLEYLVYAVPQRSGTYGYFLDNFQILTEPIPRAIWKDKPIGAPFENIFLFDYGNPIGMTRSLPGEGWFNLGWAGVVIWCGLWGWCLGFIYRRYVQGPQGAFHTLAYLTFLPILIIAFRDGILVTVFRQGIFYFAPILLLLVLARVYRIPSAARLRESFRLGRDRPASADSFATRALPPAVRRRRLARQKSAGG